MITIERREWLFWLGLAMVWGVPLSGYPLNPWLWWSGHGLILLSLCSRQILVFCAMMWVIGYVLGTSFGGGHQPPENTLYVLIAIITALVERPASELAAAQAAADAAESKSSDQPGSGPDQ